MILKLLAFLSLSLLLVSGQTVSPSPTPSVTPSVTPSITPSPSPSITPSITPSLSVSPSITPTRSVTPSVSTTPSGTPSNTPSNTPTPSVSPSPSITPSPSQTPAPTPYGIANPNTCLRGCVSGVLSNVATIVCSSQAVNSLCTNLPIGVIIYNSALSLASRKRSLTELGVAIAPTASSFSVPVFMFAYFGNSLPAVAEVDPASVTPPAGFTPVNLNLVVQFTRADTRRQVFPSGVVYVSVDYRSTGISEAVARNTLRAFLWDRQRKAWVDADSTVTSPWRVFNRLSYTFAYSSTNAEQIAFFVGTAPPTTTTTTTGTTVIPGGSGSTTQLTGGTGIGDLTTGLNIPNPVGTQATTAGLTVGYATGTTTLNPDLHHDLPLDFGPNQTPGPVFIPTPVPLVDNPFLSQPSSFHHSAAAMFAPALPAVLALAALLLALLF